jgi:multidrug efflux system outer membrane protein
MMRRSFAAGACLLLLLLAGCKLTPDYERPELGVPPAWDEAHPPGDSIANLEWWELYQDRQLEFLIRTALEENKDLGIALARIAESSARVTVTRSDQFPFVDVFGDAGRGRQSQFVFPDAPTQDQFGLSAQLSFELDIWRKYSRATEGARADLLATEAAYRSVTISLVGTVANAYLLLRDLDARLAISERTARTRSESLEIIDARFEKGIVPELDVHQARIELAEADAAVATFERQVAQAEHALRILIGRYPGPIARGLALEDQQLAPEIPAGLPSELLQRRPDVVAAEQQLAAETARIGVAEALRWPSISLTASLGTVATELSDLNTNEAKAWNILAGVIAPIFNSGRLKANARAQRAVAEQLLRNYEATVLQAFREVEDSLVAVRTLRVEHEARLRARQAAQSAARLSRARYDGGVVDYLEVLDSERSLFRSELEESSTRRGSLEAIVQLYKALGGGWNPDPPAVP